MCLNRQCNSWEKRRLGKCKCVRSDFFINIAKRIQTAREEESGYTKTQDSSRTRPNCAQTNCFGQLLNDREATPVLGGGCAPRSALYVISICYRTVMS